MLFLSTLSVKNTSPEVGVYSLRRERPTVVFPHPDSPTRPSVSPGLMFKGYTVNCFERAYFHKACFNRKILFQVVDLNQIFSFICHITHCSFPPAAPPSAPSHSSSRKQNVHQASGFPAESPRYRFHRVSHLGQNAQPLACSEG